jgi:DNA processing protein
MDVTADPLLDWLILLHAPGVGPRTYAELLQQFPDPGAVRRAGRTELANLGLETAALDYLTAGQWPEVDRDLEWLQHPENHALTLHDPRYPPLLREITDAPPVLFVRGAPEVLMSPQLAMVGSRNPTPGGAQTAHDFAAHLARAGLTITSGLALGIDAACHRGALAAQGSTIAVAGTGLDRVYPASHRDLAHAIVAQGALVSEFPPGTPPLPENFPRRNRLISALSLGTLVVEAALRSGSLITARHAVEQGREVFAIPGSIHNPLARGCHALIREGAKLVETAADIIEELGALAHFTADASAPAVSASGSSTRLHEDPEYRKLFDCMDFAPLSIDQLVERSGLTPEAVSSMLLIMELQGCVVAVAGGRYARAEK